MADRKISDLTALTTPASVDYLPIVDISEAAAASKNKRITLTELFKIPNAVDIATGTTTGTKIGTATTQKISLWNATPVVQPAAVANITTTATTGSLPTPNGSVTIANAATPTVTELLEYCVELEAKLEDLLGKLRTVGIIAT
jgi:hypothetical protein